MRSRAMSLALLVLALVGCKPYVMERSAVDEFPRADQELDFLAAVEKMPAVTSNDALHAFLLLQDGDDPARDYAGRVAEGVRRGWIPAGHAQAADEVAKVGWLATAGCVVMQVKGGLTMRLVGPIPRYATKELVYMEILPLRTENQALTGSEFVDYLNRLERMAGQNRRAPQESPLGVPAGESAVSPANEGAIQEGSMPAEGPREVAPPAGPEPTQAEQSVPPAPQTAEPVPAAATPAPPAAPAAEGPAAAPVAPPSAPVPPVSPKPATKPAVPGKQPSQVPGTMKPGRGPARPPAPPPDRGS